MRHWTLLSFLGGALLALLVVSTHKPARQTATRVSKPLHTAKPMVPGAATLASEMIPVPAKTPVPPAPAVAAPRPPVLREQQQIAKVTAPSAPPQETRRATREEIGTTQAHVRMERDPQTGTLRPCLETTTNTAASPAPAPTPMLEAVARPVPPMPAPAPKVNTVVLRPGATIAVRLSQTLSTRDNREGQNFTAVLDQPITVDGVLVAPAGTPVEGRVIDAERARPLKGLARLSIVLTQLRTADGQVLAINTLPLETNGRNIPVVQEATTTASAVVGGSVRMVAGRSAGSAVGGMFRNVIGTSSALVTGGRTIVLAANTPLRFRLLEPVTVSEVEAQPSPASFTAQR